MAEPDQPNDPGVPPMRSQDYSEVEDWPGYFASVLGKGARETLVAALDSFAREGFTEGLAVDIAAGEGRDALELLRRGWRVVATDNHPDAFPLLWSRVPEASRPRLTTVEVDFAEMQVPDCDLVNASFALPFCKPGALPGAVEPDRRGDSPGRSVCGSVLRRSRHLGVAPRSDAPQPGRGAEAAGGLRDRDDERRRKGRPAGRPESEALADVSCGGEEAVTALDEIRGAECRDT